LRALVCDYIELFNSNLCVDSNYVERSGMRINASWGTENEIVAFASMLRCHVYVYSSVGAVDGQPHWLRYSPNTSLPCFALRGINSIYINHVNENHYEPVTCLRDV
jgi:hypothetical protein